MSTRTPMEAQAALSGQQARLGAVLPARLRSHVCRFEHFNAPWYAKWAAILGLDDPTAPIDRRNLHRKVWEFSAIAQALDERGQLAPMKRGLGFAVGREPLVSLFAARGATVLATDIDDGDVARLWQADNQHSSNKEQLYAPALIDRAAFDLRVEFRPVDMRHLAGLEPGSFDFLWSACALEHLGSLEAGATFVKRSADLLKDGGVAVHTTEYNVGSDEDTLVLENQVIYRRQDLITLAGDLSELGFTVSAFDFDSGNHRYDLDYDRPPWYQNGRKHIKLELGGYIATSILIIIEK
jgi:SAM-dependent methyltransferase